MGFDAMHTSKNCYFKQPRAFSVIDRDFFPLLHLIILTGHCVLPDTPTGFVMQPEQNHYFPQVERMYLAAVVTFTQNPKMTINFLSDLFWLAS